MNQIDPNHQIYPQKEFMVVFRCNQQNKTYNIELQGDTTLGEIGNHLSEPLNCQIHERCVFYLNDQELQSDQTLNSYGIKKGTLIDIKIQDISQKNIPLQINITIQVPANQKKYDITVNTHETIEQFTQDFSQQIQLQRYKKLKFCFNGLQLVQIQSTFQQYGINEGAILQAQIETDAGF